MNEGNGLGVKGGRSDLAVEIGEILTFTFANPVTNVLLNDGPTFNICNVLFTVFNDASQIGSATHNPFSNFIGTAPMIDISSIGGGGPLTSFTATVTGGVNPFFNTTVISFDPVAPVPPTASALLLADAVAGAGIAARRRKRAR